MKCLIQATAIALAVLSSQTFCQTDSSDSERAPVRNPRTWAISGEVGINSLSSLVGPMATFYVKPRIPLDLGIGLSAGGLRPGLRARYLFSPATET